jgi:hypothetical protein
MQKSGQRKKERTAINFSKNGYQMYTGINPMKHYHGSDRPWLAGLKRFTSWLAKFPPTLARND